MSFRGRNGALFTGSNDIPLGNKRRFGSDDAPPPPPPMEDSYGSMPPMPSRGRPAVRELNEDGTKKRIKKNRWGAVSDNRAAGLMDLPFAITGNLTGEQLDAYGLNLRIEEISQKLRISDVVPPDGERSPSPVPQYDNQGRRVNTREFRYKKKLEDERHKLIQKAVETIPSYHPPPDYRRPTKTQEKIYVPVNDYPEINFIGLLIGPRGNTLKKMETESGAKIAIRGKGSVKEGKGRSDAAHTSNQEEDLHCLILADTEDKVNKAKKLIHNVIETAASTPETQNELKRGQLRELAALNGTLRDDENQACQNCGELGHRKYDCPNQRNVTSNIICRVCGNAGHMARDCPDRQAGGSWRDQDLPARSRIGPGAGPGPDGDVEGLLQELGGGAPARLEAGPGGGHGGYGGYGGQQPSGDVKPWERGPTGGSAPWQSRGPDRSGGMDQGGPVGGPAPWSRGPRDNYGGGGGGYGGGAPSGGAAPWQQRGNDGPRGGYGGHGGHGGAGYNQGYGNHSGGGGYGQSSGGGAPWQRSAPPPPPPSNDLPPPPPADDDAPPPPPPA